MQDGALNQAQKQILRAQKKIQNQPRPRAKLEFKLRSDAPIVRTSSIDAVVDGMGCMAKMALWAAIDIPYRLDAERLRDALDCVAITEPALAATYIRKTFHSHFLVQDEPDWPIEEHRDVSEQKAALIEDQFIIAPFHRQGEIPIALSLLHMEGFDRLLIRVSHVLVDGGGTKNLMYRLASAYRSLGSDPTHRPQPKFPGPRGCFRLIRGIFLRRIAGIIRGYFSDHFSTRPRKFFFVPMNLDSDSFEPRIANLHVDRLRVAKLRERYKPQNITINDLLVTAFSKTLEKHFGEADGQPDRLGMIVTADLRKHLSPEYHLNNLSALRVLEVGRRPLSTSSDLVRAIAKKTMAWKRNHAGLGHALGTAPMMWLPDRFFRGLIRRLLLPSTSLWRCRIALTNIGPINDYLLDFGSGPCLNARIAPPVADPPYLITGATGCGGSFDFSLGYRSPALRKRDVQAFLQDMDEEFYRLSE